MDEVTISKLKATCLSLLAKVKRIAQVILRPPPKQPESWLGSFSKTGRITADIVSPPVLESEWEATRRDTTSHP
jgi:hypothetical protein